MRTIERTNLIKRDFKRELKGQYRLTIEVDLVEILNLLVNDLPMQKRQLDHALSGDWKGFRDCHIKPDLVLIYQKPNEDTLQLTRIGSHSELGL